MAATAATPTLSMKLLINGKAQRVLFAEASKEVVDFLFSLLAMPVATAVKLVEKDAMVGCVGNLYASVDKLDSTYLQDGAAKDSLLSPTVLSLAASAADTSVLRLPAPSYGQPKAWYRCTNTGYTNCRNYITDMYNKACPSCGRNMTTAAECLTSSSAGSGGSGQQVAAAQSAAKGFVQGTVTPMSAISSITLLNTFAVRDIGETATSRRRPCSSATTRVWRFSRRRCSPSPSSPTSSSPAARRRLLLRAAVLEVEGHWSMRAVAGKAGLL